MRFGYLKKTKVEPNSKKSNILEIKISPKEFCQIFARFITGKCFQDSQKAFTIIGWLEDA